MNTIYDAYRYLYRETCSPKEYTIKNNCRKLGDLSHFVALRGKYYENETTKLLLVGRAVNGWSRLNTNNETDCAEEAANIFNTCTMDWIEWHEEKQALGNHPSDTGEIYWLSRSPFWVTAEQIWRRLPNVSIITNSSDDNWTNHIAWSNLYKVAPLESGNPTSKLCKDQLSACKNILREEIDTFKPTHILFVVGYKQWFRDFEDSFDAALSIAGENKYRQPDRNGIFAEAYGHMDNGIKIVVSCRPEFRDSDKFVSDIIDKFAH